jgi:hypothetical protein
MPRWGAVAGTFDIEKNVGTYLGELNPLARYASFDYCFNYFQFHREEDRLKDLLHGEALQLSCLHLGFYLASWGMLRASAKLSKRSMRAFIPVVEAIASAPTMLWTLDVDGYDDDAIGQILGFGSDLRTSLPQPASDILVTKIMLGTMGCVPAFDTYFTAGFRSATPGNERVTFRQSDLRRISNFYQANAEVIDRHRIPTLDFATMQQTNRHYTRAKVLDMIFFIEGA